MTALAYVLMGAFLIIERVLRKGSTARRLAAGGGDGGTTRLVGVTYGLAFGGGLVTALAQRNRQMNGRGSRWAGLIAMVAGLTLRAWAARSLGHYYSRTLQVASGQPVVQSGPYRFIRHPGYLADIVLWAGFGLAHGSRLLTALLVGAMLLVYGRRITVEERLLLQGLGNDYAEYRRHTWRLLPPIY